jgi:hypothetical protein
MKDNGFVDYINEFYGQGGIYSECFGNKLSRSMIEVALAHLEYNFSDFLTKNGDLSREQFKAYLAMVYPQHWAYEDCEYGIGMSGVVDKGLVKMRKKAKKIWISK